MKTNTTFDNWDTTPVTVKRAYTPESYTAEEWDVRREVDVSGDEMWTNAGGSLFDLKSLIV